MTAAQVLTYLRDVINEPDTTRASDAVLGLYCQSALEAYSRRTHYRWRDDATTITLIAGTGEYTGATDWLEILWVEYGGRFLAKGDLADWQKRAETGNYRNDSGRPAEWAYYGRQIVFWPKPDAATIAASGTHPTVRAVVAAGAFADAELAFIPSQDHRVLAYYAAAEWFDGVKGEIYQSRAAAWYQKFEMETKFAAGETARKELVKP